MRNESWPDQVGGIKQDLGSDNLLQAIRLFIPLS